MYDDDLNKSIEGTDQDPILDVPPYDTTPYEVPSVIDSKPKKKSSFGKFIIGLTVVSLVGGVSIGGSFALLSPYAQNYYDSQYKQGSQNELNPPSYNATAPVLVATTTPVVEIAKNIGPCVVSINNNKVVATWYGEFNQSGIGSGVIFKQDDNKIYIITNAHVIEGANSLMVNFLGNTKIEAELIGADALTDIAVVAVNKEDLLAETLQEIKVAPLGDSDQLQVGELAVAIGTPMGEAYNNTVTGGYISALNRQVQVSEGVKPLNLIQTDAAINPGNSGGALVGPTGEVIGINSIKLVGQVEGMGFAIPINDVKPIIEEILQSGKISRPALGIAGSDISARNSQLFELPVGIYIEEVIPGGSGDLAGLKVDDILFEFDGTKITGMTQLKLLLNEKKVGDIVQVKIIRGNSKKTIDIKLREATAAS